MSSEPPKGAGSGNESVGEQGHPTWGYVPPPGGRTAGPVDVDPLVTALLGQGKPCDPANVWTARGFPGPDCSEDRLRLYVTPELDEWLEIPRAAVRHFVQCDGGCAGLGGVVLWIDRSANVQHTRTRQVEAPRSTFRSAYRPDWSAVEEDWTGSDPGLKTKYCG